MSTTTAEHVTIEDARSTYARAREDYNAGRIDNETAGRAFDTFEATVKQLDAAHVIEGCPDWCNDHEFEHGVTAAEDVSSHRRTVKGNGWAFIVGDAYREPGSCEFVAGDTSDLMTLEDARAYAVAILETIDTVTGATR